MPAMPRALHIRQVALRSELYPQLKLLSFYLEEDENKSLSAERLYHSIISKNELWVGFIVKHKNYKN